MNRREVLKMGSLAGAMSLVGAPSLSWAQGKEPIKVGILHSLSGTMAISETSLKDVALMTIAEINKKGGVLGRPLQPVVVDPASDWPKFAEMARQLLTQDKVAVAFGCWTSVSRKSVLPVFEELNGLLFYPVQYEGQEMSRNVFYTGAAPNQQAIPALDYLLSKEGGGAKRIYLLGTDYVYPRTTNKILRAYLLSKGFKEADIAEEYTPFGHSDYQTIVGKVKAFAQGGKTAVVSTINGDSNVPFYKELGNQGLKASEIPVVAFSVGEEELRGVDTKPLVGQLAAWNYFETLKNPTNDKFKKAWFDYVKEAKIPNGATAVTNDPMEATYVGINMWAQAVAKAKSIEVDKVRPAVVGQTFDAPCGFKLTMDGNHHLHKPVFIGEVRADGQFNVVWKTKGPVRAEPWSPYIPEEKKGKPDVITDLGTGTGFSKVAWMRARRLGWLFGLVFCWHLSAWALTAQDVQPLAGDDFDAKQEAIQGLLAKADDPQAAAVLRALADDNAQATEAGQVVIMVDGKALDAVSGQPVADAVAQEAQPISLNNSLRSLVGSGMAALDLAAPDAAKRLAAVNALLANPDASFAPLVNKARERETDPAIKAKLDALWATTALQDPNPETRLSAVKLVAARHQLDMRDLLKPFVAKGADGSYAEADPRVREAAQAGLTVLDRIQWWGDFASTLFAGLSLGSILLLAALGLAITYGLIGVINMAHGEFLMVGAYATYAVQNLIQSLAPSLIEWYPLFALPAAFAAAGVLGIVLEQLVLRHLYGRPLETLLTTFGVSLIMMQGVRVLFGAQNVQVANPDWMSGGIALLPNLVLPYNRIAILVFTLIVVVVTWAVLTRTRLGLFVRAVTQNRDMAACVGVKTRKVDSYAFAFGAGIAGLGGVALSQVGNVGPNLGQGYIIDSFMSVVLGGVGQLAGTVIGSIGLGLLSKAIEPFWGAVLAKIAVLILIVLFIQKRPQGLFALKGRSAEN